MNCVLILPEFSTSAVDEKTPPPSFNPRCRPLNQIVSNLALETVGLSIPANGLAHHDSRPAI